jgi:outer membrane protein assembly factor BamB
MEKVKRINGKLALTIIAVLLISSSLVLLNSTNTVSAQTQSELLADDMYGWPVGPGYDSGNTFFNPGPGPNRPDILWTARNPNTGASMSGAPCVAFDGLIFSHSGGGFFGGGSDVEMFAFDPFTGAVEWSAVLDHGSPRGFGTATYFKVADGYLGYETSNGIVVLSTRDGSEVAYLERDSDMYGSHGGGSVMYWGGFYSSYDNLKLTTALSNPDGYPGDTPVHLGIAYDLSDPENPELAWTWVAPTGIEALGSAPGLAIFGGYGEGEIYAVNATTGELVWKQWKEGNAGYACNYWDGKIYHSASSTAITCYNATNGDIIFDYNEGGREWFVFGDAIAYGKYIGKNIAVPWGYVGAWDANTGEPLWKAQALYTIAYLTPCVADGKLYCQKYSGAAGGAEEQVDTFACWDVFTGALLWELIDVSSSTPIIAYGNLYLIDGGTLYCIGDKTDSFPMFHGGDDVENPGVREQSGPIDISEPRWEYDAGAPLSGSAVAGNGKVYFGTLGGEVHCVDAKTGEMEWTFPLGYRMASTPALIGDNLYIGPDDGNIYCINAETGEEEWKISAGGKTQAFWVSAWQSRSSPIVVSNRLYVGSLDGQLYCVNAGTGSVIWTTDAGDASRPPGGTPLVVEDAGMVFITSSNALLHAYDIDDGTELWSTQLNPTSGFDDRALVSTPVWDEDDGTLWIVSDTMLLCHLNATDGEFINSCLLPYSAGSGTMTPAITTPAIHRVGNEKHLYVGDGFQLICFDITTLTLDPMLFVTYEVQGGGFFSSEPPTIIAYYKGPPVVEVNATTANNVNLNVSLPNYSGNETNLPVRWERWLGHQVYSSPVVADVPGPFSDVIYFGDDQFSITAINASDGNPLSVYTTRGQVFSSACLYDGWMYMGSQDGTLYAFASTCYQDFTITASANKADEMWNNETLVIRGRLLPTVRIDENGFGTYDTNGYANATVNLSVTKPDNTDEAMDTTTDEDGWFEFSYSPTEVGDYGWVVYYDGEEKPWITFLQAYGEWTPISVTSPTASGGTEPPPENGGGVPVEYVYVAVAVIVIVLVAVGVYLVMKRRQ